MGISLRLSKYVGRRLSNRYHHQLLSARFGSVLSHPSTVDGRDQSNEGGSRGRIVCITSGKGGVGKTTSAASFAFGLASVSELLNL